MTGLWVKFKGGCWHRAHRHWNNPAMIVLDCKERWTYREADLDRIETAFPHDATVGKQCSKPSCFRSFRSGTARGLT